MAPGTPRPALSALAARLISIKARQVVRRPGFTPSDWPDVEQDLALDLLRRLPRFDPARASLRTFVNRVVEHRISTLIEAREAAMRDHRRHGTLHEEVSDPDGEAAELLDLLDEESCRERVGLPVRDPFGDADLRADLEEALRTLPTHLRDLARRLQKDSPSEVARSTGIPRTTLLKRMGRIRAHLDRAGLHEYLRPPASTRRRLR